MNKLYLLDFDRTVFDTQDFFQDFSTVLASYFGIDGDHLHAIAAEHNRVREHATGIFSAFDMILEHYPEVDLTDVKRVSERELIGRTYTYLDVIPAFRAIEAAGHMIEIVTVGTDDYQWFKRGFAPAIEDYPFTVTQETKGACLHRRSHDFKKFGEVILIDDRGDTFDEDFSHLQAELDNQPAVTGVRINRVDSTYADIPTPREIPEITTLLELIDAAPSEK